MDGKKAPTQVLIVDDDAQLLTILRDTLQRFSDNSRLTRRVVARLNFKLHRFDELLPVLMDHGLLLNSCVAHP